MSQSDKIQVEALTHFRNRNKFLISSWNQNRPEPASEEFDSYLNSVFDTCAEQLINAINDNFPKTEFIRILKTGLSYFNNEIYDRDEREFICDFFYELARMVSIDINKELDRFLYGTVLATLLNLKNIIKPLKAVETLLQPCSKCGTELETHILKKEKGIPETNWWIVRCKNCREFNLISVGEDVKESRSENYDWVENISTSRFTYEQAIKRLEQIRYYRK